MIDEAAAEPPSTTSRALVTSLASLCAVFFVAVIILSIVAVNQHDARQSADADRRRVEQTASQFAVRLLTYDYRRLDDSKALVLALSTGKFRDEYTRDYPGLKELITAAQLVQQGTPQEIYVSVSDSTNAKAIVVSDIVSDGKSGHRSRDNAYVRLTLVRVSGAWKVDAVDDLNFSEGAPDASSATTSTTTAVPGK